MKKNISIQIKAIVLLVVFGLNTIVGFACAAGLDMGFNTTHHHSKSSRNHIHAGGENHHQHNNDTANKGLHHHESNRSTKDDCCNKNAIGFQSLDKNFSQNVKKSPEVPVFFTAAGNFLYADLFKISAVIPQQYIVPTSHPPPAAIRIAIHRFQI